MDIEKNTRTFVTRGYKDMLPSQYKDWRKEHERIYVMVY